MIENDDCSVDKPIFIILLHLSMSHYFPLFEEAGINLDQYSHMNLRDLLRLGIQDPGDLDVLYTCARTLRVHMNKQTIYEEPEKELPYPSAVKRAIDASDPRHRKQANTRPLSMPVFLPSQSPPPDYYHDVSLSRKERCKSMIIPREEEGKEELPAYSCTVFKMGYVNIKKEFDCPNTRSRRRNWRKLYFELWGTMLRIYRTVPPKDTTIDTNWSAAYYYYHKYYYTPIYTLSLAGAEASRAFDYIKRPNVLRLSTHQGPQFLLRLSSHVEMISWVEHLQAAINISLDLEDRPMPKFITLPTRALASGVLDPRNAEIERIREQRRRDQREILI